MTDLLQPKHKIFLFPYRLLLKEILMHNLHQSKGIVTRLLRLYPQDLGDHGQDQVV